MVCGGLTLVACWSIIACYTRSLDSALDRAALLWGIEPQFWDIWGNLHVTQPETKQAILRAMGVPVETEERIEQAIAARQQREWKRLVPPCLVISENQRPRQFP